MDAELRKKIEPELRNLAERIKKNHQKLSQKSFGDTLKSIELSESKNGYQISANDYFEKVSDSLKLGRKPQTFKQIVEQWAKDKGIKIILEPYIRKESENWKPSLSPYERGLKHLADLTAFNLMKEGTSLDRLKASDEIYNKEIPKSIEKIKESITEHYVQKIIDKL